MINSYSFLFSLRGITQILQYCTIPVIFFYIIFAFVLIRQVKLLNKSISTPIASLLDATALIHFVVSIVVALLALMSL
jgi:hypothetical protein